MKLYDVPRESYVRISPIQNEKSDDTRSKGESAEVNVPIAHVDMKVGQLIFFDHIDGMYSFCHPVDEETLELSSVVLHPAIWTEVEIVSLDEMFTFEEIREKIGRSGYGKDQKGEYREASLSKMNDNWVNASINFVPENHTHRKYYIQEMKYRSDNNIVIEDPEA